MGSLCVYMDVYLEVEGMQYFWYNNSGIDYILAYHIYLLARVPKKSPVWWKGRTKKM